MRPWAKALFDAHAGAESWKITSPTSFRALTPATENEYRLIATLLSVAIIAAATLMDARIFSTFNAVSD
jgi:hypothetical protein